MKEFEISLAAVEDAIYRSDTDTDNWPVKGQLTIIPGLIQNKRMFAFWDESLSGTGLVRRPVTVCDQRVCDKFVEEITGCPVSEKTIDLVDRLEKEVEEVSSSGYNRAKGTYE